MAVFKSGKSKFMSETCSTFSDSGANPGPKLKLHRREFAAFGDTWQSLSAGASILASSRSGIVARDRGYPVRVRGLPICPLNALPFGSAFDRMWASVGRAGGSVDERKSINVKDFQALRLLRAFSKIADPKLRQQVITCAEKLASDAPILPNKPPTDSAGH
jgi:hypothetical protein